MQKDKVKQILDLVVKNSKIVFPILVIAIVAATVVCGLRANEDKVERDSVAVNAESSSESRNEGVLASVEEIIASVASATAEPQPTEEPKNEEVPLVANQDPNIYSIVAYYYNSVALGDKDMLLDLYDEISENDILRYVATADYLDYYTELEVYTKPGPVEGSTLAYVYYKVRFTNHTEEFPGYQTLYICTNDAGELYIKNEANFTEEEIEYIKTVNAQADVVDFSNRVSVEYNDMMVANPDLLEYLGELGARINAAIGEALEAINASEQEPVVGEGATEAPVQEPAEENVTLYAVATTTVNVRSSDSEQADRLGQVAGGTRIQVQEVRLNGWTKVLYEGKDGYIKSEYLQMEENISGLEIIGKVTATTNINIRSAADETATRLGVLVAGESLELFAVENGWCKVKYNGQVAYVKADYVTQQ